MSHGEDPPQREVPAIQAHTSGGRGDGNRRRGGRRRDHGADDGELHRRGGRSGGHRSEIGVDRRRREIEGGAAARLDEALIPSLN